MKKVVLMISKRQIDWNDLRVLLEVSATGSLNAAATRLGTTQPTISRKISELEAYFQAPLVVRSKTGSALTERALEVLPFITKMARAGIQVEKLVRHKDDTTDGNVVIAGTDLISTHLIAPKLGAFSEKYPNITIKLDCGFWQTDLEMMRPDITVGYSKPSEQEAHSEIIGHGHYCWFASLAYLKQNGIPREYGDLMSHMLVWHVGQQHQREDWPADTEAFATLARSRMRVITNSSAAFLAALKGGAGIGALPSFMCEANHDLVPLQLPEGRDGNIYLSTDKTVSQSTVVRKVSHWLKTEIFNQPDNQWLADEFHHPHEWWSALYPEMLETFAEVSSQKNRPANYPSWPAANVRKRQLFDPKLFI